MILDAKFVENIFCQLNTILACLVSLSDIPTFVKPVLTTFSSFEFFFSFLYVFPGALGIGPKSW